MKTEKTFFVLSDVHGEAKVLDKELNASGFSKRDKNHMLVFLGDMFDRGPNSYSIYHFLMDFKRQGRAIILKGNHETFFQEFLSLGTSKDKLLKKQVIFNMLHNGLDKTIESFYHSTGYEDDEGDIDYLFKQYTVPRLSEMLNNNYPKLLPDIRKMPVYFETDHFIFSHAGISPLADADTWKEDIDHMLWDIKNSHKEITYTNKTVVFGHHHAARVRTLSHGNGGDVRLNENIIAVHASNQENRPFQINNKIAIDACTNLSKAINILVIKDTYEVEQ